MDANFRLCEDLFAEDEGNRGTGGGVSCRLEECRGTGGEEGILVGGGDDRINGDEGVSSSGESA